MNRSLIKILLSSLFVFVLVTFAMSQAAPPPHHLRLHQGLLVCQSMEV